MYTGKNILVGQSGGPTAVINASLAGVLSAARQAGIGKIYGMRYGLQGLLEGKIIDLEPLTSEKNLLLLQKTPAAYLGSCRVKLPKIDRDEIELLACGNRILWILPSERFESVQLREKGRFSADFAINGETETVLLLEVL